MWISASFSGGTVLNSEKTSDILKLSNFEN